MADKKIWQLTITTGDTGHDDNWPYVTVVRATDEEMAALEKDLGDQLYSTDNVDGATHIGTWREEHAYLLENDE